MRAYLGSETGKEHNKNFFMPFSFVGALTALIQNQPSKLTYEALTECNVYEVNFHDIGQLCKEDITISNLYNRILEHVYIRYEERQLELISMDAKDRYITLRKKIPKIDELIPQYQIASYLSITPVQLSRIRRKIKKAAKCCLNTHYTPRKLLYITDRARVYGGVAKSFSISNKAII